MHYGLFFIATATIGLFISYRLRQRWPWLPMIVWTYVGSFLLFQGFLLMDHSTYKADGAYEAIVVLGSGLERGAMTEVLALRLDEAYETMTHHDCPVILSGGLGTQQQRNESEAMFQYLVSKGMDADRLIQENRSTSTWENLLNSQGILEEKGIRDGTVLIVSSNFHLPRIRLLASRIDFDVQTRGALVPWLHRLDDHSREYYAMLKSILLDWHRTLTIS